MKARHIAAGFVLALIALGSIAATSGGFPSRPRFQAVGVNAAAPAAAGSMNLTGSNAGIVLDSNSGTLGAYQLQDTGTLRGLLGASRAAGGCITGDAAGDVCLRTNNQTFRISTNNGSASALSLTSAGNLSLAAPSSGDTLSMQAVSGAGLKVIASDLPQVASSTASVLVSMRAWETSARALFGTTTNHPLHIRSNDTDRVIVAANGAVTVNAPSSAVQGLTVFQAAGTNVFGIGVQGTSTAGQSNGLLVQAGTGNAADRPFDVLNNTSATRYFGVLGTGGLVAGAPTGGEKGVGTLNATGLFVNNAAVNTLKSVGFRAANNSATAPSILSSNFSMGVTAAANAAACSSSICQYDLTGFAGAGTYLCNVTTESAGLGARIGTYSAGNVTIQTFNTTTGAATNANISVVCTGT